jgi:hypothetical protein
MSRLKKFYLSFWRKDRGFGIIEAALVLPLFLIITFGVIEFGNIYISDYQAEDVAEVVGDYLQANPSATVGDLSQFVSTLGVGTLKDTGPDQDNNVLQKIKIQSVKTMLTDTQFDALCSSKGSVQEWANPWLLNGSASDDNNPYYIYVCYPYTYKTITPLSGLTAGLLPETRTLKSKTIVYINAQITCPAGQFLSNRGGKPECTQVNAVCPNGKYLKSINGTTPECRDMKMVRGPRFNPMVLDGTTGSWKTPSECYLPRTTETCSGGVYSCRTVFEGCRSWKNGRGDGCRYGTKCETSPRTCSTSTTNLLKSWSMYTNGEKVWCTPSTVNNVLKPTNDCPPGAVQVGISDGGKIWCSLLSIKY